METPLSLQFSTVQGFLLYLLLAKQSLQNPAQIKEAGFIFSYRSQSIWNRQSVKSFFLKQKRIY